MGKAGDNYLLFHEMTHHLDHNVIMAWGMPIWFREGLAEYFGNALLKNGGGSLELGRAVGERRTYFLEAIRNKGKSTYIPLEGLLDSKSQFPGLIFYSECWALVHYLLDGPPSIRAIAYDVLAKATRMIGEEPLIDEKFEAILQRHGLSLKEFEKGFLDGYKKGEVK